MSAEVGELFQWWCDACSEGGGTFDQRAHARAAASRHNELNHEDPNNG